MENLSYYGGWQPMRTAPVGEFVDVWFSNHPDKKYGRRFTNVLCDAENLWVKEDGTRLSRVLSGSFIAWRYGNEHPFNPAIEYDTLKGRLPRRSEETDILRIVCAANRLEGGTLILGARHCDDQMRAQAFLINRIDDMWEAEQGFMDNRRQFQTRESAWKIAAAAGQIIHICGGENNNNGHLFSENLY